MSDWYSRSLFFVADAESARDFYVNQLGFAENWKFDEDGRAFVVQVSREGCEIILSSQWPEKNGKGMLFISLSEAAYAALPGELARKAVAAREGWWGYRVLIVTDPDGNELYFADPTDRGGSQ